MHSTKPYSDELETTLSGQRCLFPQILNAHLPGQDMAGFCLCGLSSSPNHLTGDRERPGKGLWLVRLSKMFTWIRFSVWCGRSVIVSGNSWWKTLSVACLLSNMQWIFLIWDMIRSESCWRPQCRGLNRSLAEWYTQNECCLFICRWLIVWIIPGAKPQVGNYCHT